MGDHSFRLSAAGIEPSTLRLKRQRFRTMLCAVGVLEKDALALKSKLRSGIARADRADVWMSLLMRFGQLEERKSFVLQYHRALDDAFGGELHLHDDESGGGPPRWPAPPSNRFVPAFGGEAISAQFAKTHGLAAREMAVVSRILCTLSYATCRDDCPPLPDVVAMLAHELPEPFAYGAALALLESGSLLEWDPMHESNAMQGAPRSGVLAAPPRASRREIERSALAAFADLVVLRCRRVARHLALIGCSVAGLAAEWFNRLFVGTLPYPTAVRVFDSFLLEGAKVLFRVGVALLQRHARALLACATAEQAAGRLRVALACEHDGQALMAHAFGLRNFSFEAILELQRAQLLRAPHAEARAARAPAPPRRGALSSFFVPRLRGDDCKEGLARLCVETRRQLWAALPPCARACDGVLVFSNLAHGSSLRTLYERCARAGVDGRGALVVVRAIDSPALFGGYSSLGVRPSAGGAYGTGESLVFSTAEALGGERVRTHGWSRANGLFAHGDASYWAMGGGRSGGFGLWLDHELDRGASAACETFASADSLHEDGDEHFRCHVVEVWALR